MSDRPRGRLVTLAALALAVALLAAGPAVAQTAPLTATDFFVGVQQVPGTTLTDNQVARFFNKKRCDCDEPVYIFATLSPSGQAKGPANPAGTVTYWVGDGCDVIVTRAFTCALLGSEPLSTLFSTGHMTVTASARLLSGLPTSVTAAGDAGAPAFGPNATCTAPVDQFTQTIWALVDENGDGAPTLAIKDQIAIDLTPPPAPDPNMVTVVPRNEELIVGWQGIDTTAPSDAVGYQILCNRGGALQVFDTGTFAPGLQTCPTTMNGNGVEGLDPAFVCSPLLSLSTRSYPVRILQNGISYGVAVVAIDQHGNASPTEVIYGTPLKSESFYDVYRKGNDTAPAQPPGGAAGGYCALGAPAPRGRGLVTALVLLGLAAVVARRRRRHRR